MELLLKYVDQVTVKLESVNEAIAGVDVICGPRYTSKSAEVRGMS